MRRKCRRRELKKREIRGQRMKDGKGETRILAEEKKLWLSHIMTKKQKNATQDWRSKLLLEVNSVQCLLLFMPS